eukprot:Colp12_sorted_trinity150504_noHs@25193
MAVGQDFERSLPNRWPISESFPSDLVHLHIVLKTIRRVKWGVVIDAVDAQQHYETLGMNDLDGPSAKRLKTAKQGNNRPVLEDSKPFNWGTLPGQVARLFFYKELHDTCVTKKQDPNKMATLFGVLTRAVTQANAAIEVQNVAQNDLPKKKRKLWNTIPNDDEFIHSSVSVINLWKGSQYMKNADETVDVPATDLEPFTPASRSEWENFYKGKVRRVLLEAAVSGSTPRTARKCVPVAESATKATDGAIPPTASGQQRTRLHAHVTPNPLGPSQDVNTLKETIDRSSIILGYSLWSQGKLDIREEEVMQYKRNLDLLLGKTEGEEKERGGNKENM